MLKAGNMDTPASLSVRQMEVIYAVARYGSVTEAARVLGISQPAVSVIIQECNRVAGVQLFERKQGRLQPTPETGALLPEIERVQTAMRRVRLLVKDYGRTPRGNLRIAAVPIMADNLMPAALKASQRDLAGISISVICRDYEEIPDLLDAGRIDIGLSSSVIASSSANVVDLWKSELIAVMCKGHALASRATVSACDLADFPLIAFNHNIPIGLAAEKAFQDAGQQPNVAVEVSQTSTAIAFARAGLGVSIIHPLGVATQEREGLEVRAVTPAAPFWNQALLPKAGDLNRSVQVFLTALRRASPRMRQIEENVAKSYQKA